MHRNWHTNFCKQHASFSRSKLVGFGKQIFIVETLFPPSNQQHHTTKALLFKCCIIIIITEIIFMVLSSWQSHCESSPGSFDECRLSAEVAANPQTKPTDLDCESARNKWQLPSTSTIVIYYYSARELILILPSHGGWKAEST